MWNVVKASKKEPDTNRSNFLSEETEFVRLLYPGWNFLYRTANSNLAIRIPLIFRFLIFNHFYHLYSDF